MNIEIIAKITADLAAATRSLAEVTEQLATTPYSLDGLVAWPQEERNIQGEVVEQEVIHPFSFQEDIGLVKNIDILPPVEAKEEDEIDAFICKEKIDFSEADAWLFEKYGKVAPQMISDGIIPANHLLRLYAKEVLARTAAKSKRIQPSRPERC